MGMRSQRKVWRDISTAKKLGQAPLAAPSVFNFYTPDFAPQGEISDIGLTAPEFKLTTSNYLLQIQNLIWQMSGATGGGRKKLWAYDASDFLKAQKTSTDLVALVDERFFGQTMSDALRQRLIKLLDNSLNRKPALSRVRGTLYVALTSPEFFAEEAIV
ncbi:DUF1800 family protein [Veronia nyctiphanis]|uniref:DUF1800 family protein n=1 Tax=Veronia nyctiphanis TaxID=1278244 RepID=UPI0038B5F99A